MDPHSTQMPYLLEMYTRQCRTTLKIKRLNRICRIGVLASRKVTNCFYFFSLNIKERKTGKVDTSFIDASSWQQPSARLAWQEYQHTRC